MHTLNLNDHYNYPETDSCYLDGRYFDKIFQDYEGLVPAKLHISINGPQDHSIQMDQCHINTEQPGLLRTVIETPESRHSNLLILDYDAQTVYRFEPLGSKAPFKHMINTMIIHYLGMYLGFNFTLEMIDLEEPLDEKSSSCPESGFCSAYVMLYGYDYLTGQDYDPSEIKRFSQMIESEYGPLPKSNPDVEMGYPVNYYNRGYNYRRSDPVGALGGGLVGGVLGGAVLGPVGALAGGLGGAALGSRW